MKELFLGIDTSNYKTSVAIVDETGAVCAEKSELLDVPVGKRGLRQSEAFFMHSNRLPDYLCELFNGFDLSMIKAAGVSERPRRVNGSYMPCFLAGINASTLTANVLNIPLYRFSHQEGHAAAVLEGPGMSIEDETLFFHLSGGTTEMLLCRPDPIGYFMEIAGGTLDISIGQLFDRFGVAAGFSFPAGRFLDDTAYKVLEAADFEVKSLKAHVLMPKISVKDGYFNLSGAETKLMKYIESGACREDEALADTSAELFIKISSLLLEEASYLCDKYGVSKVIMAGGVSSSKTIRRLLSNCKRPVILFGDHTLSGDNAVGIARLAKRTHETRNSISGK